MFFRKAKLDAKAPLDPQEVEAKIRSFVSKKTNLLSGNDLEKTTSLFISGILDSLAFVEMMLYIDEQFNITIAESIEVSFESMDNLEQIVAAIVAARK